MSTKTKSKLSDPKYLTRRLKKLSPYWWNLYVVDGEIFQAEEHAVRFARKMAQLRVDTVSISTICVPSSLSMKEVRGCTYNENTDHEDFPPVKVYFVLGKPFLNHDEAQAEAVKQAAALNKWVDVMDVLIEMKSLDFVRRFGPHELAKQTEGGDA